MQVTSELHTQARKTRYTNISQRCSSDHLLTVWRVGGDRLQVTNQSRSEVSVFRRKGTLIVWGKTVLHCDSADKDPIRHIHHAAVEHILHNESLWTSVFGKNSEFTSKRIRTSIKIPISTCWNLSYERVSRFMWSNLNLITVFFFKNDPGLANSRLSFYCTRCFIFCLVNWFLCCGELWGCKHFQNSAPIQSYFRNKGVD